jgi:uncharacterized delta-60 repeat protein
MHIYQRLSLKVREERWSKTQRLRRVKFVHSMLTMMAVGMLVLLINGPAFAQQKFGIAGYKLNGSLDSSFDGDGKVIADLPNGASGSATAVAIDASSRIVVAGTVDNQFALARYYLDGSPDSTFGNGGYVLTNPGYAAEAKAIAIDKNGRIVVAGKANGKFTLARHNPDGSLDTTFSSDGIVQTSFPSCDGNNPCSYDSANAVTIDGAGKIVAAGTASVNPTGTLAADQMYALARYNPDGSLDNSFGGDGRVITNHAPNLDLKYINQEEANAIAIDGWGRILVAGRFGMSSSTFAILRYNANGSLDTSFGDNGDGLVAPIFQTPWKDDAASAVAIDKNGKIVVAGKAWGGVSNHFALVRLNPTGTLDATFGGDGKVVTSFGWCPSEARAMTIDSAGKILVAGWAGCNTSNFALARYQADGSLDPTFNGDGDSNGQIVTDFTCQGSDAANAITLQFILKPGFINLLYTRIIVAGSAYGGPCQ